jgi:hypothetical protein
MPFVFKKVLDHGATNPIVARLSFQVLGILDQCDATKDVHYKVGELYATSLQRKLIRCWEIEQRFLDEFNAAAATYNPPAGRWPTQILEEDCHNFLYEAKNYLRDLLKVFNLLYGTQFKEASEFSRAKKGKLSLVEWASKNFGGEDPKAKFLQEGVAAVNHLIDARNAVEHPDGYSGTLRIENFTLEPDGRLGEPVWCREKDNKTVAAVSSIRADIDTSIHNLLVLGEDVLVSWAADHLKAPSLMRIALVPSERRNPHCPVKYVVTASVELEKQLAQAEKR